MHLPLRPLVLIALLALTAVCMGGVDDDDTTAGDDDDTTPGDDDDTTAGDDDDTTAGDDDDATPGDDDDTTSGCTTTAVCSETFLSIASEAELKAIAHCDHISGDLSFDHQAWLTQIDLPCLETVGSLDISGNGSLSTLSLPALTAIERGFTLYDHDTLASVDGLDHLEEVGADIHIFENHALRDLDGLAGLRDVGGDLAVEDNDALRSCQGLAGVETVTGNLFMYDNRCLAEADADACTATIDVGGATVVHSNGDAHPCP